MAKISPVSIKYMVYATFRSEGPVEKPDVIGAIFGQTEGLLGADLEMRELQKEGKIGRIEVDLSTVDGKSVGEIQLPSALDKSETTIIAATLETIDKIGPTEAKIEVTKIEDVRGSKRDYIIDRAKKLLEGLESGGDLKLSKTLRDESRIAKIQEYGDERLPAGDIIDAEEVIVVEGRADVVNLLKNRVNNVVGMDGAKLPKTIAELGKSKELTLFVDGDRGGKLIAKNVIDNAKVTYVATAPDGKEVEELTGKEILMSLRKKVAVKDFMNRNGISFSEDNSSQEVEEFEGDVKKELKEKHKQIKDTRKAIFLDNSLKELKELSAGGASSALTRSRDRIYAVVVDGPATAALIRACDMKNISYLAATNFAYVKDTKVELISV